MVGWYRNHPQRGNIINDSRNGTRKLVISQTKYPRIKKFTYLMWDVPWMRLWFKSRFSKLDKLAIDGGITPVKLLFRRFKCKTLSNLPNHEGISPFKKLKLKSMSFRRLNRPNSLGKWSWKLLRLKLRETRNDRFPNCGGMVPVRPMLERSKTLTLWCLAAQETPTQLQTELLVVQLLWGSVIWCLNARRACWSVVRFLTIMAWLTMK